MFYPTDGGNENPKGLSNAYAMATASPRMMALAIGGEDSPVSTHGKLI